MEEVDSPSSLAPGESYSASTQSFVCRSAIAAWFICLFRRMRRRPSMNGRTTTTTWVAAIFTSHRFPWPTWWYTTFPLPTNLRRAATSTLGLRSRIGAAVRPMPRLGLTRSGSRQTRTVRTRDGATSSRHCRIRAGSNRMPGTSGDSGAAPEQHRSRHLVFDAVDRSLRSVRKTRAEKLHPDSAIRMKRQQQLRAFQLDVLARLQTWTP